MVPNLRKLKKAGKILFKENVLMEIANIGKREIVIIITESTLENTTIEISTHHSKRS